MQILTDFIESYRNIVEQLDRFDGLFHSVLNYIFIIKNYLVMRSGEI